MTDHSADQPTETSTLQSSADSEGTLKTHLLIGMTASMTMMAEKVGELAVATKTLTRRVEQGDEERERDRRWFKLACFVFAGAFLLGGLVIYQNRRSTQDTAAALAILQRVTGPEANAAQAANTALIVTQIIEAVDCKVEENNRIVLESIRTEIPNIRIPEVRDACREIRNPQPTPETTTTTSP